MTNKFLWIYLTGIFLILALPLLNLPPWFSPSDWGKIIVFRIIMTAMILVFIWQLLSEKKLALKTNKPFWLLIGLLGIFFLATIFSLDKGFSFWGSPYRSAGFLNFAFFIIFTLLVSIIIRKSDWPKIWNFSLIVGVFVCIIAIFQSFKILENIFVHAGEPWSTIGSSSLLGLYLLILTFVALSSATKSIKNLDRKWFFYLPVLLLFIFVILLTGSRASYLGLIIGLVYFVFAYPHKMPRAKTAMAVFGILVVLAILYLNTSLSLPQAVQENKIFKQIKPRLSVSLFLNDPRFSVWRISLEAIFNRPLLGYGPENFSIAFDKYYDPSLPRMMIIEDTLRVYYDRAHNFLLETGVTAGIPALIIHISLFVALFLELRKIKRKQPQHRLLYHGIQTSLIAYFIADFFGFDSFSTYLISFLLIAYSLYLINEYKKERILNFRKGFINNWLFNKIVIIPIFIGLLWFVWAYNIKPFQINIEINRALYATEAGQFERALRRIEDISKTHSFLDDYIRANYLNIINTYIQKDPNGIQAIPKAIEITKQSLEQKPTYTRYWILLGTYYNILLENYQTAYPEYVEAWTAEAEKSFEKAWELSPKRQEIFISWSNVYLIIGDYEKAKEKAQKCIDLNPNLAECWWLMALININMNEIDQAKENIKIAEEKNYPVNAEWALLQLHRAYSAVQNNEEVCNINYKLSQVNTNTEKYMIDVFLCYLGNKKFEQAKELAKKIIQKWPVHINLVNEYLEKAGLEPISKKNLY